jgi:hypothetical protein
MSRTMSSVSHDHAATTPIHRPSTAKRASELERFADAGTHAFLAAYGNR